MHDQGQKSEQKHTTKSFVGFHNHSPLLTMPMEAYGIDSHQYFPVCQENFRKTNIISLCSFVDEEFKYSIFHISDSGLYE